MNTITLIPVSVIRPNPENPRKKMNEEELVELSKSIKAIGLLQPITVRHSENDTYEIVCGHRRYEAVKMAGMREISCIVRDLSDDEAYEIMVTENLQRKDVDPFDEAAAFAALRNRGYDTESLAYKFGKSKTYIFSRLKLSSLIPEFVKKYEEGAIDFSHCLILARLNDNLQQKLLKERYNGGWNDLSGKTVNELKSAITTEGMRLADAVFDTSACAECPKNAGCASLFLEMSEAVCMDTDCYASKFVEEVYPKFEQVRKRNPDFFIMEDWDLKNAKGPWNVKLIEKLRQEGFKFISGESAYDYEPVNKGGEKNRYNIDNPDITAYTFGYYGFLGPEKERESGNSPAPAPWKSDYNLDRMAKERELHMDIARQVVAEERIDNMGDAELLNNDNISVSDVMRAALVLLLNKYDSDSTCFGLEGDMENMEEAIDTLTPDQLTAAAAKLLAVSLEDCTYTKRMFPEQYSNLEDEAKKKFYDNARRCWHGYDEVTNEMIEEDLKSRTNK